jgi:hypothetical protein
MLRVSVFLAFLFAASFPSPVRAEERPVTNKIHKKEQQFEGELKSERDRPAKKERAKAAAGRVEDGVRDFGRGLQGVMKEAGIGDGPGAGAKKPEARPAEVKPGEGKPAAPAKPAPAKKAAKPAKPAPPTK